MSNSSSCRSEATCWPLQAPGMHVVQTCMQVKTPNIKRKGSGARSCMYSAKMCFHSWPVLVQVPTSALREKLMIQILKSSQTSLSSNDKPWTWWCLRLKSPILLKATEPLNKTLKKPEQNLKLNYGFLNGKAMYMMSKRMKLISKSHQIVNLIDHITIEEIGLSKAK